MRFIHVDEILFISKRRLFVTVVLLHDLENGSNWKRSGDNHKASISTSHRPLNPNRLERVEHRTLALAFCKGPALIIGCCQPRISLYYHLKTTCFQSHCHFKIAFHSFIHLQCLISSKYPHSQLLDTQWQQQRLLFTRYRTGKRRAQN